MLQCLQMQTSSENNDDSGRSFRVYAPESIGAAIRYFRDAAGLSQAELAEQAGVHRSYLSQLEQGHETEHLRQIFRVLRQLGVRITLEKADW